MRICDLCGYPISDTERTMITYRGLACDICAGKIDDLTPNDNLTPNDDMEEET